MRSFLAQDLALHSFGTTHVQLPKHIAAKIKWIGDSIPKSDLAEDGLEKDPHVTVKYGLHPNTLNDVKSTVAGQSPINFKMGDLSVFPANEQRPESDVLVVKVESPDLYNLNKKITDEVANTTTYSDYQPHATIAYLKPGKGAKYSDSQYSSSVGLKGLVGSADKIIHSDEDGNETEIPLKGFEMSRKINMSWDKFDAEREANSASKRANGPGSGRHPEGEKAVAASIEAKKASEKADSGRDKSDHLVASAKHTVARKLHEVAAASTGNSILKAKHRSAADFHEREARDYAQTSFRLSRLFQSETAWNLGGPGSGPQGGSKIGMGKTAEGDLHDEFAKGHAVEAKDPSNGQSDQEEHLASAQEHSALAAKAHGEAAEAHKQAGDTKAASASHAAAAKSHMEASKHAAAQSDHYAAQDHAAQAAAHSVKASKPGLLKRIAGKIVDPFRR